MIEVVYQNYYNHYSFVKWCDILNQYKTMDRLEEAWTKDKGQPLIVEIDE